MKTRFFDYFIAPGHVWVKASKRLLPDLGIAGEITSCSYERGDYVYLEEDCDMGALCAALRARGIEPKFRQRYADWNSRIRGCASYHGCGRGTVLMTSAGLAGDRRAWSMGQVRRTPG